MSKIKKLTYLLLALLIVACSNETKKNDLTENNLYGKVKSLTTNVFNVVIEKFGEVTKGEIIYVNKETYDDKGNMIETSSYNSDGSLAIKYIFEYDDKGNKTERSLYNSDGSLDSKYIYKYDDKGNETESSLDNSDGSLDSKYIYKYDDKGNMIEKSLYNSDGSLDSKYIYEYEFDNKGNWINVIVYSKGFATDIQEREIVYY